MLTLPVCQFPLLLHTMIQRNGRLLVIELFLEQYAKNLFIFTFAFTSFFTNHLNLWCSYTYRAKLEETEQYWKSWYENEYL